MDSRCFPAWCWGRRARGKRSRRWREWLRGPHSIPCNGPLRTWAPPSADTAPPAFSSPPRPCWRPIPGPRATKSRTPWRATSAAARVTSRSTRQWSWRRRGCGGSRTRRRARKRSMAGGRAEGHRVVGRALRKVDAVAKVTGQTRFADDLTLPRMLYAKLLRSPHPHARIFRVDTSRAEALEGVVAVLTGKDLPTPFGILPVSQDEHALSLDKVRFVGDPVAAVAALDEETAERALRLIDVEYEVLAPVMSIEDALAPDAPAIHDDERYQG